MVEVGVSLDEKYNEYDLYKVKVNDLYYGLYDENVLAFVDEQKALEYIKEYVEIGVDRTYGVMWEIDREIEDYEREELVKNYYLEDEFLPRDLKTNHFYIKENNNERTIY